MNQIRSVLFVTYHFPPEIGGIHTRIIHYIQSMRARGIRVTVFVIATRGLRTERFKMFGADVFVCTGRVALLPRTVANIIKSAVSGRADVIHVFTGASTFVGISSLLIGRVLRVPSVVSFFGKEQLDQSSILQRMLLPFALGLSTAIGVNTNYTKSLLPISVRPKTSVLTGGAELPLQGNTAWSTGGPKTILFVGRLVERKGGDDLLKAFKLTHDQIPDCRLVFVGDGPDRERLNQLTNTLGIKEVVEFRGTLVGNPLQNAYEESSVVVLPSKHVASDSSTETMGFSLIEASMHAKPLVGTIHGGIPEIIRDGTNGFLVPEGDPARLSEALFRIISDSELGRKLGRAAYEIALQRYTWNAATERLLGCYGPSFDKHQPSQVVSALPVKRA